MRPVLGEMIIHLAPRIWQHMQREIQFFGARATFAKCSAFTQINGGVDEKHKTQVAPKIQPNHIREYP